MGVEDDVQEEHSLLIDPCYDDQAYYLAYDPTGPIFSLGDTRTGKQRLMFCTYRAAASPRPDGRRLS